MWITAYSASSSYPDCNIQSPTIQTTSYTLAQAVQCSFGQVLGNLRATEKTAGTTNILVDEPTNAGTAFPDIDCGTMGTTACVRATNGSGDRTEYYFYQMVTGALQKTATSAAYDAAAYGWKQVRTDSFTIPATSFGINWTALTLDTTTPSMNYFKDSRDPHFANTQVVCTLNNASSMHVPNDMLDGVSVPLTGVPNTIIGWQTQTEQESGGMNLQYCEMPAGSTPGLNTDYDYIISSGYSANNGQFLEVQTDVAGDAGCAVQLQKANHALLGSASPPGVCPYP